ncbi:MAG: PIG-L family deacetylase [Cytophagales bacterium]|nr:MAG: PIG-L family deacetylase [Cytophagales bacterium]
MLLLRLISILVYTSISFSFCLAQTPIKPNSSELYQSLKKLKVCGSVLYLAAHPDDENTNLITVLAKERLLNTSYLSLTRGDGGQNLIGTEKGDILGIIRTQELLEARKIDGGNQYFARAKDFGFSKLPEETFSIWDKDKVLYDVVWAIRYLKPDVIITRFSLEPGKTHGHHTASTILGVEAFDLANNPKIFSDQLQQVSLWQPHRIVWNSSKWFYSDDSKLLERKPITMDCGNYSPIIGKSYNELSAESRSMHKSQGFGSVGNRGSNTEYFEHLKGPKAEKDIFEGIDFTWNRINGGGNIILLIDQIIKNYQIDQPENSVPALISLYKTIASLPEKSYWQQIKLNEINTIIKHCLGLYIEINTNQISSTPGAQLKLSIEAINRSKLSVILASLSIPDFNKDTLINKSLDFNKNFTFTCTASLNQDIRNSQPYWLRNEGENGMFNYNSFENINPSNPPMFAKVSTIILGSELDFNIPLIYKKGDPVNGEVYKPFEIWNPVFINLNKETLLFNNNLTKEVICTIKAGEANSKGVLNITAPLGWKVEPQNISYYLAQKNEEQTYKILISPSSQNTEGTISFNAIQNNKTYQHGYREIIHKHISPQIIFPKAAIKVKKIQIHKNIQNIAYLMGAGDEIPECLNDIGYTTSLLSENQITSSNLKKYDALVIGIRAFNTIEKMKFYLPKILEYTYQGGNVIVQYNTNGKLLTDSIAPYKLKLSNERVTVETAPMKVLNPNHQIFNFPNKITDKDFENWQQERGLYFAGDWGKEFEALLSSNDPGENEKKGILLFAKYGKGTYIYTGLSFFRELPAGVGGAYRLFANLLEAGKKK